MFGLERIDAQKSSNHVAPANDCGSLYYYYYQQPLSFADPHTTLMDGAALQAQPKDIYVYIFITPARIEAPKQSLEQNAKQSPNQRPQHIDLNHKHESQSHRGSGGNGGPKFSEPKVHFFIQKSKGFCNKMQKSLIHYA